MNKDNRSLFEIPSAWQLPREAFGIFDAFSLLANLNKFSELPKGNGQQIIVFPGYATSDLITIPLRNFLTSLSYKPQGWVIGRNDGNVPHLLEIMNAQIRNEFQKNQKKIILIGWSLGGYLAREVARDNPDLIEKVITLGSPVIGGPKYTSISNIYAKQYGIDLDNLEKEIDERYQIPISIPLYSIYSKQDNIVGWEACIDNYSPNIIHTEINSTHIGLIANWESYKLIAEYLAK